jgi:hypothetical protein
VDLVCGNYQQSNTLYFNEGGVFQAAPSWSSEMPFDALGVALGDVDSDGDLDLVCANTDQPNTLYLNDEGVFSALPDWSSEMANTTYGIALGDVNNDGGLDLFCGNKNQPNTLYLNEAGMFSALPNWTSGSPDPTYAVAVEDVDGDGNCDLICGNAEVGNTLYLNEGGAFSVMPAWESEATNTTISIALGDVNGDGRLDLVCGNYNQSNTLYFNTGGVFSATPSWSLGAEIVTTSIALGDLDNDGDLDLICANIEQSSARNMVFAGLRAPVFKGDPLAPVNHLPNNSAFLRAVAVSRRGENLFRVRFAAVDVESDPIWVLAEYQYRGDPTWHEAAVNGQYGKVGPFSTTPAGIVDSLDWDVFRLPFDRRDVILRLRTISVPRRVSLIHHVSSYLKEIGPIEPRRSVIFASPENLSFSTVTVGDTVSVQMTLRNAGNVTLSISAVELPSPEMRLDYSAPLELAPGDQTAVTVYLEPRRELHVSGDVRILSNDPLYPVVAIPISTDIRTLDVVTELLTQAEEIPLGEAVTADITPASDVNVEQGLLFHRPGGATQAFADSIALSKTKSGFIAIVPGEAVTETGLEYYVKVENSGVFGTDPQGAPDSFYTQAVEAPAAISSFPKPNSGSDYLNNRPLRVEVILPDGAIFISGLLRYREGGESEYQTLSIADEDPLPVATIPDSAVGPRGLEYWVEVNTRTRLLTDPQISPSRNPRTIQITVQNLEERTQAPGSQYRIISIPVLLGEGFSGTIEALLSDQPEFGPYDPVNWRCWAYLPETGGYGELSDQSLAGRFRPEPGRAFWLISRESHRISTAPVSGLSTPTDGPFALELASGWNMIGSPFAFPVAWDSVLVDTLSMGEAVGVSIDPPIRWNGGYSSEVSAMEPFDGYWIYNRMDNGVTLYIPAEEAATGVAPTPQAASDIQEDFRLSLKVTSGDQEDRIVSLGTSPGAERGLDRFDRMKPPPAPQQGISLYLVTQMEEKRCRRLSADIRPHAAEGDDWGDIWALDVMKSVSKEKAGDAVKITARRIMNPPDDAGIVFIDRMLDRRVAVDEDFAYTCYLGTRGHVATEEETRFRIIVGTESFIQEQASRLLDMPASAALYQNYPNPFNPSTVIRYDIAEPGMVSIRIYDVTGTLVRILESRHRDPGRYEVGWNGKNDRAEQVAAGIYFYRLTAPGYSETRKMVLIR